MVDYPDAAAEKQMLLNAQKGFRGKSQDLDRLKAIATVENILMAREAAQRINVDDKVLDYFFRISALHAPTSRFSFSVLPGDRWRWPGCKRVKACPVGGQDFLLLPMMSKRWRYLYCAIG